MRPSVNRQGGAGGFSLIELIIVILILAIAAAVVVPQIGSAAESQVTGAARLVASDLEAARSLAVTTQQPHSLVFNPARTAYKVAQNYTGGEYVSTPAIAHPVRAGQVYEVDLARQNGMGRVTVTAVNFGGATYVTFNSRGEPSSAGQVTLQAAPFEMAVSVEALTGNIEVAQTTD
jgi:prepilin-type N-terminal cleavage/methylation domain-containing protein